MRLWIFFFFHPHNHELKCGTQITFSSPCADTLLSRAHGMLLLTQLCLLALSVRSCGTHTQMPLTQAEAVFWSHKPPDWLRTLDETHATIPASPAYLHMIGCNHNTWHSDTDLALVLQRSESSESMKQKQVTVSHFPCTGPVRFNWKRWSLWNVLILQFLKGYLDWILSALLHLFLN